jgi:hypothetical protein
MVQCDVLSTKISEVRTLMYTGHVQPDVTSHKSPLAADSIGVGIGPFTAVCVQGRIS